MAKPAIILVTGSFALPEFYDNVVKPVVARGYEIRALHSPTVSLETSPRKGDPPTMYDDAAFISREVEKLADEGKEVLLMAHSYGGIPTTQGTKGLGKQERQKAGKEGGIVRLAYMTALVPELGKSAQDILADVPVEHQLVLKIDVRCPLSFLSFLFAFADFSKQENGWMYHDPISRSAEIAFSDLPPEEGQAWVRQFGRHSAVSFAGEATHQGYKDIPVSFLVCEDDICVPLAIQENEIKLIENVSGSKVDVMRIKAGHCPSVSKPQEVVDWILHVAAKV